MDELPLDANVTLIRFALIRFVIFFISCSIVHMLGTHSVKQHDLILTHAKRK